MKYIYYLFNIIIVISTYSLGQTRIDSIEVLNGWNNIGALSEGATIDIIDTEPPGIVTSTFFGYMSGEGYYSADSLRRGKGYWVKVSQDGIIYFMVISSCGTVEYSGKTYTTIIIGEQCWLVENLDIGIAIIGSLDQADNGVIEKYCYGNNPNNCNTYGGLYQWNEAMQYSTISGSQGICPTGWHIPTNSEYMTLRNTVSWYSPALKAIGQGSGYGEGTNTSGFSALLGGFRIPNGEYFGYFGNDVRFWSSTESANIDHAGYLGLTSSGVSITVDGSYPTGNGFSIRCLKD